MAVQKSRKSQSKKKQKVSSYSLKNLELATDISTGESHIRHILTYNNYYRGYYIPITKI
ncbi:UNVERIFIED_CONTAM: hypothetical protein GTU68_036799 [Idotea baltica]|nr:hypothetical protein [Idotea baltica]